jgi:hypothetical protein
MARGRVAGHQLLVVGDVLPDDQVCQRSKGRPVVGRPSPVVECDPAGVYALVLSPRRPSPLPRSASGTSRTGLRCRPGRSWEPAPPRRPAAYPLDHDRGRVRGIVARFLVDLDVTGVGFGLRVCDAGLVVRRVGSHCSATRGTELTALPAPSCHRAPAEPRVQRSGVHRLSTGGVVVHRLPSRAAASRSNLVTWPPEPGLRSRLRIPQPDSAEPQCRAHHDVPERPQVVQNPQLYPAFLVQPQQVPDFFRRPEGNHGFR